MTIAPHPRFLGQSHILSGGGVTISMPEFEAVTQVKMC
jgi:hypothetical protein